MTVAATFTGLTSPLVELMRAKVVHGAEKLSSQSGLVACFFNFRSDKQVRH